MCTSKAVVKTIAIDKPAVEICKVTMMVLMTMTTTLMMKKIKLFL